VTTPAVAIGGVAEAIRVAQTQGLDPTRWGLSFGTVSDPSNPDLPNVVLDGDSTLIPAISLVGPLATRLRVAVITVPPSGNYVVATLGGPGHVAGLNAQVTANGNTASAAFSNYPSPYTITLTKTQTATGVLVRWSPTFFTDNAATGPEFGVQITVANASTDYATHNLPGTLTANVRLPSYGERKIAGVAAGTLTITGRWRRLAGAGTIFAVNLADYASLTAEEVL
jgi:hypothetical protein